MALRRPLEAHFYHFWAPAAQMAFSKVLEVHRGSGSSLHRTCVADVTFYRPCPPEECARGALLPPRKSFARTFVVDTIFVCTLVLDSPMRAP